MLVSPELIVRMAATSPRTLPAEMPLTSDVCLLRRARRLTLSARASTERLPSIPRSPRLLRTGMVLVCLSLPMPLALGEPKPLVISSSTDDLPNALTTRSKMPARAKWKLFSTPVASVTSVMCSGAPSSCGDTRRAEAALLNAFCSSPLPAAKMTIPSGLTVSISLSTGTICPSESAARPQKLDAASKESAPAPASARMGGSSGIAGRPKVVPVSRSMAATAAENLS
mmetsp:Transcript_7032/g.21178  ORF Transcript_7032/g.21178 Transcript_7032/m.21178 type:complete len:227 (-) Transcript_7032:1140-1820(-)